MSCATRTLGWSASAQGFHSAASHPDLLPALLGLHEDLVPPFVNDQLVRLPIKQLRENIQNRDPRKKVSSKVQAAAVLRQLVREQVERRAAGAGGGAVAGAPVPATPAGNPPADGSGPMDT